MTAAQWEYPEAVVRGFPYRILYALLPDALVILAYAHERRKPGYWIHRASNSSEQ